MNIKIPKDDIGYTELLLRCDCYDIGCAMSFGYWQDEPNLYVEIVACDSRFSLWKRVWQATKYVLGMRDNNRAGIVLTPKDAKALETFLDDFRIDTNEFYKKFGGNNTSNDIIKGAQK